MGENGYREPFYDLLMQQLNGLHEGQRELGTRIDRHHQDMTNQVSAVGGSVITNSARIAVLETKATSRATIAGLAAGSIPTALYIFASWAKRKLGI